MSLLCCFQETNTERAPEAGISWPAAQYKWEDKHLVDLRQNQKAQDVIQLPREFPRGLRHKRPGERRAETRSE